jgi:hypothetical protein
MTKEQILTAIEQAISTGEINDVNTGFITTIKEQNAGIGLTFWVGTQAQYNAIETKSNNCFYIVTDDQTIDIELDALKTDVAEINENYLNTVNRIDRLSQRVNEFGKIIFEGRGVKDTVIEELLNYNVILAKVGVYMYDTDGSTKILYTANILMKGFWYCIKKRFFGKNKKS